MTDLRITVTNTSNTGGTFLTPTWYGFHDNSFDLFDVGSAASGGLEAIAEDGNFDPISAEFLSAVPGGQEGIIPGTAGPIATGEQTSTIVDVDAATQGYLSVAAMILPSNDLFFGTNTAIQLFDDEGNFLGAHLETFGGERVYDAGTEVNTELDAAFINQMGPNTGIDQNGVVQLSDGFNGSVGNPVGEGDQIILGGTNAFGVAIDEVEADFSRPGAEISTVWINTINTFDGTDRGELILGGSDDDFFNGGAGGDVIFGRSGFDVIDGGANGDRIFGGTGNDEISGGAGSDFVRAGTGNDVISGGDGNDFVTGNIGDDQISGDAGNDALLGNRGADVIDGGDGNDLVRGGLGNDVVMGGAGNDRLFGGANDDFLYGGAGDDGVYVGIGDDTISYASGDGADRVFNFDTSDTLVLAVEGIDSFDAFADLATEGAGNVAVDFGDGDSLLFVNTTLETLSEVDYVFG